MTQLLQNAAYGTAMILAVVFLRRVLKGRLVPGARLALWAVCLFRLLTPAAPESVLSLWGMGRWFAGETQSVPTPAPAPAVPNGGGGFIPATPGMTASAVPASQPAPEVPWETILLVLWAAVGLALAVRYVLSWRRTRRAVSCAIPVGRDDPRYLPLPKCARLREGPMDGAPLTFGAVKPTVVLSPGLDGAELECVLAHEGVHARRRDNLWHYATALALVVHWWNPVVWLMARLLRRDVELSCDRAALKKLGAARRADYANALVSMATQAEGPAFCQTFGRKAAEERIISIMKYKKTTIAGAALTLALVLAVTVGFASNPVEPGAENKPYNPFDHPELAMSWGSRDDGTLTDYTIDLRLLEQSLAKQVAKGELTQEKADEILEWAKGYTENDEGYFSIWTFDEDIGLTGDENGDVFYKDEDGSLVKIAPENIVSGFIFPARSSGTVEFGGRVYTRDDLSPETLDWLDWYLALSEEEQLAISYVPAELNQGRDPETQEAGEEIADTRRMSIDEYKALLDGLVADGKMSQEDADWFYAGAKQALDAADANGQGDIVVLKANETGSYAIMTVPPCNRPDCGNLEVHQHNGVTYSGWIPGWPVCGEENCTVSGVHHHEGETVVHHDSYTAILGDLTQSPVCPVEGCTTPGYHDHSGMIYACNGAHCGGVCDGSCYSYNDPIVCPPETIDQNVQLPDGVDGLCGLPLAEPSRTDCYPDSTTHHSESHHSESRHTSGHHGNHH